MSDTKNKLIALMSEFNIWCLCNDEACVKSQNFDLAVQDIKELIEAEKVEARLQEAKLWFALCDDDVFYAHRHIELNAKKDTE